MLTGLVMYATTRRGCCIVPTRLWLDRRIPLRYTGWPFKEMRLTKTLGRRAEAMKHNGWWVGLAIGMAALSGCVDRRYVVYTDPPGALVLRNGQPIGSSPADDHFVYYGNYHFTIVKDGYETLQVDQKIVSPWYEYPILDFFAENLTPWPILDRREFHYRLEPRRIANTKELMEEAQNLRNRGISLGGGSAAAPAPAELPLEPPQPPPDSLPPPP